MALAAYPRVRCAQGQLTLAQINANTRVGTVIVPAEEGKTITVVDGWMRATGHTMAGCTAIILTETGGSPTTITSTTAATLTAEAVIRMGVSGVTSTNVGTTMRPGRGLTIGCTVGDATTSHALDYCIFYTVAN